jgi:hypothetical protein
MFSALPLFSRLLLRLTLTILTLGCAATARAVTFPTLTAISRSSASLLSQGTPLVMSVSYTAGTDPVVSVQVRFTTGSFSATAKKSGDLLSFPVPSTATPGAYVCTEVSLTDSVGRIITFVSNGRYSAYSLSTGEGIFFEGTHALNFTGLNFTLAGGPSPASFVTLPAPVTVAAGESALFYVDATGTPPITYQWTRNNAPISGATNSVFTISYVQPGEAGLYGVTATSPAGSASASTTLTVTTSARAPSFAASPGDAVGTEGGSFAVSAQVLNSAGGNIIWRALIRDRSVPLTNGSITTTGSTVNAFLSFGPVTLEDAGDFQIMATNASGTAFSAVRTLIVLPVPVITTQPVSQAIAAGARATLTVAATGRGSLTYQWYKNRLYLADANKATYEIAAFKAADAGSYTVVVTDNNGSRTSAPAELTLAGAIAPTIITQPTAQTVPVAASATFTVVAAGTGPLAYQWNKDGRALQGAATSATLTLTSAGTSAAGRYTVTVTNAGGSITSAPATLTVLTDAPAITTQPQGKVLHLGESLTLSVIATGNGPLNYQWFRESTAMSGATNSTLHLERLQMADALDYTVRVSNTAGAVTSIIARVLILDPPRLINLSLLTRLAASDSFILGFVVGGARATGTKPLLIRAAGPTLSQFGVGDAHPDPKLELFNAASTRIDENDNWGGDAVTAARFAQVGAFAFNSATSKDAAIYAPALNSGSNSVRISGAGSAAGTVLAELYETTPSNTVTSTTPRLINVSVLKKLGNGMTAGFVVRGTGKKQVLIRAIGPSLAIFQLADIVSDPEVTLYEASGQTIASNDNWNLSDAGTMTLAGAFGIPAGKDAVIVASLDPGSYTLKVSAKGENPTGSVLLEVYELP